MCSKESFDIRSIWLSLCMAILFGTPLLVCAVVFHDKLFYILFVIILSVFVFVCFIVYVSTKKVVVFSKEKVCVKKNDIEIKNFLWQEIRIEYCDVSFFPVLEAFTIKITYFDLEKNRYNSFYVPASRSVFYKVLGVSKC